MKGIIEMHRFNICLVVVLLWCESTITGGTGRAFDSMGLGEVKKKMEVQERNGAVSISTMDRSTERRTFLPRSEKVIENVVCRNFVLFKYGNSGQNVPNPQRTLSLSD